MRSEGPPLIVLFSNKAQTPVDGYPELNIRPREATYVMWRLQLASESDHDDIFPAVKGGRGG